MHIKILDAAFSFFPLSSANRNMTRLSLLFALTLFTATHAGRSSSWRYTRPNPWVDEYVMASVITSNDEPPFSKEKEERSKEAEPKHTNSRRQSGGKDVSFVSKKSSVWGKKGSAEGKHHPE